MYKKINDENSIEANVILRTTDNTFIPKDPANTDYQEYLAWVAEGNTPEEAE
jgi:hypothetical protein